MAKKKAAPEVETKTVVLNESDSALDAFCNCRGTSIVFLDEQLAALPDDNVNKQELTRLRRKVEDAHQRKDMGALDGWFHALLIGLKAACHTIPLAVFAKPFKEHSDKPKKPSPIRKAIARELVKAPTLKPLQLWTILASKPPKGWDFDGEGRKGRIWVTGREPMGWSRFSRACKEEKDKLITKNR